MGRRRPQREEQAGNAAPEDQDVAVGSHESRPSRTRGGAGIPRGGAIELPVGLFGVRSPKEGCPGFR